jgi:hypothetical protein
VGSMRQAGFTSDVPMYVASGLLTYGANDGEQGAESLQLELGACTMAYCDPVPTRFQALIRWCSPHMQT